MCLQNRHNPTGSRQGAVEGCDRAGAPLTHIARIVHGVCGAFAYVQAACLVGGAVRGRGQLAVGALGGDPRLTVEFACGRGAQVPCGGINHAIRKTAFLQHFLFEGAHLLVYFFRLLHLAVDEHFGLVELVHANDTAGVFTGSTGFTAVAG